MSSKTKKGKKKTKSINDGSRSRDLLTNKKVYAYFTNEELAEIKSTLKTKDITGVPHVIAATFLYKFDLLKKLLKDGCNINQTGQNNTTALIWAVKYKYLDIVDYLLANGADPTIKTDSGDNVLIVALEHKSWDEESFKNLWRAVKKISFIDVNFTNKNGHNMLHMCVRRDWEESLKILLQEKPDVDAANSNGVTPLMLACFRNNITIINILIEAGADILKEDNHGRMPLCYAISSSLKIAKPPSQVADKIISVLREKSALEVYFKRRLELIITTAKKAEVSCATAEMLIKIIQFSVQHLQGGVEMLLDCNLFHEFAEVVESYFEYSDTVRFLLEICRELLFFNEDSCDFNQDSLEKIIENFTGSGLVTLCLRLIAKSDGEISRIAFDLLLLSFGNDHEWCELFKKNSAVFLLHLNDQLLAEDENRLKILQNKHKKLKTFFENLEIPGAITSLVERNIEEKRKSDGGLAANNSKKSRRRSKALKSKLNKIKGAELTKRLNITSKRLFQQRVAKIGTANRLDNLAKQNSDELFMKKNPIISSLQHILANGDNKVDRQNRNSHQPEWKQKILNMSFTDFTPIRMDSGKLLEAIETLAANTNSPNQKLNINRPLNIIVDYLKELIEVIVTKYQEHWNNDRTNGICPCLDLNEHVPWLFNKHQRDIETREKQILHELQKTFDQLIKTLRDLAHKNSSECVKMINKLESMILNFEIRGIKLLSYVANVENATLQYFTDNVKLSQNQIVDHLQNVLNDHEEQRKDIDFVIIDEVEEASFIEEYKSETPKELYEREMAMLSKPQQRNKRKEIESKLNTIANGFHLINATMAICEEIDEKQKNQRTYGISDLNYPLRTKYHKLPYPDISEFMPKRLKSQISSLQSSKSFQRLLSGEIRISAKEQRVNYIISAGINFNAVELGLDINNQPLAVKRIQRESWVGKIIKTLIDPLLGLMDSHILHYFACEYEGNELILATPLCKWNMAQYVQLLRQSSTTAMPGLTAMQIVKQFLDGLMVLHKCELPIVHGNLKPSNIFIDFNGLVKIAEFGIHKALYKIIEAPKSSLIWFAKETLDIYKNSSIVECSMKSDIQVAGMLLYFILTYGKHPFGDDIEEILRNIQRGIPKLNARNLDLRDLLLWMMLNDFNERPNIEQVLSHPFFWPTSKKWSFVVCCAGINQTGYVLPLNVDKLHRSIESFADAYIKIDWQEVVKSKFPKIRLTENNSIAGLLKFIKNCNDHQSENNLSDSELSCAILSLFPTLPVALYRILQNTNWLKHAVFMPFSTVF